MNNTTQTYSNHSTADYSLYDLGTIEQNLFIEHTVGDNSGIPYQSGDYYYFTVSEAGEYNFELQGTNGDVDLGFYGQDGSLLYYSDIAGTEIDSISLSLEPGSYFVGAVSYDSVETDYDLNITAGFDFNEVVDYSHWCEDIANGAYIYVPECYGDTGESAWMDYFTNSDLSATVTDYYFDNSFSADVGA